MSRDTRPYITVTNELFRHPKFRRMSFEARIAVLELWAHCNEFMTDGHVDEWVFEDYSETIQTQLLAVGWVDKTTDAYAMHDYLEHQKSKAQILEQRGKKSSSGAFGNHIRFHVNRNAPKAGCTFCDNPENK